MKEYLKFKRSFTLIELLVVIAIIALLSSVILVSLSGPRQKARITKALEFSQSVQHAIGVEAVGIWDFDDCSAKDLSGYKNDGTINGAICVDDTPYKVVGSGQGKNALSFDGVDDYVETPAINIGTGPVTFSLWVKGTSLPYNQERGFITVFYSGKPWFFTFERSSWGSGGVNMYVGYNDQTPNNISGGTWAPSDTNWHHVAMTRDSSAMRLYLDGKAVASSTHTNLTNFDVGNRVIRIGYPSQYNWDGLIDEVRIYATALTIGEIQDHYLAGLEKHQQLTIK